MVEINKIYNEDCLDTMRKMPDNFIDLVITSPPYSDMRKYNGFSFDFEKIAKEMLRVLKDGGVVMWNVGDKTENGSKSLEPFKQAIYFKEIGYNINDVMIWQKSNPLPQVYQPRYNQVFEYMFILSKGKPKTFNPIMVDCKCAGQIYDSTVKNMGGESGRTHKTFNINQKKIKENIWQIPVAQNKTNHPAVFPQKLAEDHIISWSNEGDLVYDPFMGSGTTALAAIELGRNWIGSEISSEYTELANKRIEYKYLSEEDPLW